MSDEQNRLSELAKLPMPKLSMSDSLQYTGKGWVAADPVQAEKRLRKLQQALAVRQAEIAASGGSDTIE